MNKCLRCKQSCKEGTEFCEGCRSHLYNRLQQSKLLSQPLQPEHAEGNVLIASRNAKQASVTSISLSSQNDPIVSFDENAFSSPMQTISPKKKTILIKDDDTFYAKDIMALEDAEDAEDLMALEDTEDAEDGDESDVLLDQYDPLLSRHLPNSAEYRTIENDDLIRAADQRELIPQPAPAAVLRLAGRRFQTVLRDQRHIRLRIAFFFLALVVIVALIASSMLLFLNTAHKPTHTNVNVSKAVPALTVTPGNTQLDQIVQVHLSNFTPFAKIRLTHDVQESVRTDIDAPFITLGATGDSDVRIFVDDSWGPGSHMIQAEDIVTHFTASTVLQVLNDLPVRSPHLLISRSGETTALKGALDMGSNQQGANTLQSLVLHNRGGGWISWSAVSNQPWLMTSPQQGIFRNGQNLVVAVTRANLTVGDYDGTITIVSNTGTPLSVQVKMTVLALPAADKAISSIMLVTPPVLSFMASDGGTNPASQKLTISNPGTQPLTWSLNVSAVEDSFNQNFSPQYDVPWLSASVTYGTISPNKNVEIQVRIQSTNLLPSVYSALLTFTSGLGTLNAPQAVAISLTIQSRCGVATNLGNLTFTTTAGQSTAGDQLLSLSTTIGCTGSVNWQSFSSSSWLGITPDKGQIQTKVNSIVTVQISAGELQPGTYTGSLLFVAQKRSQTVIVHLVVTPSYAPTAVGQPTAPAPPAPVLAVSPLSLQFMVTQGQGNPVGNSLLMSNTGGGSLHWQANIDTSAAPWLSISSTGGAINPAQTTQLVVDVAGASLAAGQYSTQITLSATDNSGNQVQGSPQTIPVLLTVLPGCSFQVTPGSLSFTATFSLPRPPGQSIVLTIVGGSCPKSVSWTASVNASNQGWLILSATSGTTTNQGSNIIVDVKSRRLLPGVYSGQIVISASSSSGILQNNPVSVPVTLTVN